MICCGGLQMVAFFYIYKKQAVFDCMWVLLLSCCMKLKAKIFKRLRKNNSNIINLKWPSQSVRDT